MITSCFFFFFQAEDGIRDVAVTGVQTCALPISCLVGDLNLLSVDGLTEPVRAEVKVRYASPAAPATIWPLGDGRLRVEFDSPQRALSPGQSTVFYQGDRVLGGGIIEAGRRAD